MSLFISALGPSLEAFIKFKHSIGIQYSASVQWYLKSLDRYNFEHGNSPVLCKSLVVGWSIERSEHSNSKRGYWISPVNLHYNELSITETLEASGRVLRRKIIG